MTTSLPIVHPITRPSISQRPRHHHQLPLRVHPLSLPPSFLTSLAIFVFFPHLSHSCITPQANGPAKCACSCLLRTAWGSCLVGLVGSRAACKGPISFTPKCTCTLCKYLYFTHFTPCHPAYNPVKPYLLHTLQWAVGLAGSWPSWQPASPACSRECTYTPGFGCGWGCTGVA